MNEPREWGVYLIRLREGMVGYGQHDDWCYLGSGAWSGLPGTTRRAIARNLRAGRSRKFDLRAAMRGRAWLLLGYNDKDFLYLMEELR